MVCMRPVNSAWRRFISATLSSISRARSAAMRGLDRAARGGRARSESATRASSNRLSAAKPQRGLGPGHGALEQDEGDLVHARQPSRFARESRTKAEQFDRRAQVLMSAEIITKPARTSWPFALSSSCPMPSSCAGVGPGRGDHARDPGAGRRHVRDHVRRAGHRPRRDPDRRAQARGDDRPRQADGAGGGRAGGRGRAPNPMVFINPEIIWSSEERSVYEEGCLSIPEYYEEVERPASVKVRYLDLDGKQQEIAADGLLATCLQHEIDHLDGVLFIDHLSRLKRERVTKRFAKRRGARARLKTCSDRKTRPSGQACSGSAPRNGARSSSCRAYEFARHLHGHAGFRRADPDRDHRAGPRGRQPATPALRRRPAAASH